MSRVLIRIVVGVVFLAGVWASPQDSASQAAGAATFREIVAASDSPTVYSAPLIARTMGMFQTVSLFDVAQGEAGAPLVSVAVPSLLFDDATIRKPGGQIPQLPVSKHPYFEK